ncbi:MAG: VOC family protein [Oscillospiraceae bacterium]|jgi:lactoylglutathione lyase
MQFKNPLLVVENMERTVAFYKKVLGLRVVMDFGANVTMTGGVCFQSKESWKDFLQVPQERITFGGLDAELYFEEDCFDDFLQKLSALEQIQLVHPAIEHRWGQRAIRFLDPDGHVVEVGENMKAVCRRFLAQGMTEQEVAERMDVPLKYVRACMR